MKIDNKLILHLEKLSKLELSENEREKLSGDLSNIIDMIEKLKEVNTDGVKPLVYINESSQLLRDDIVNHQISTEKALENAPLSDANFFKVPKVIDL